ncbi:MAG: dockerin type I repeat-containing protein [Clostridia bacterium]|nr:dockerin type I repeat-containing protein [Clostridia bacterium]
MVKKIIALLLSISFLLAFFTVSAQESSVSIAFEADSVEAGDNIALRVTLSPSIKKFSALIDGNGYFTYYRADGIGYDIENLKYKLSVVNDGQEILVFCSSEMKGTAVFTFTNIVCETDSGSLSLPDVSAQVSVTPKYTRIYTKEDLNNIRKNLSGEYLLMNDIVFTEDDFKEDGAFYNDGFGWIPVGPVVKTPFLGELNGNGHTIKGLRINKAYYNYCGLFGVNRGVIQNLRMEDVYINGEIGINMTSASQSVEVIGNIDYEDKDVWTEPDDSVTEESLNKYDRTGTSTANIGMICGFNQGTVKRSYCSGIAIGNAAVGGIAGRNTGSIYLCAVNASVVSNTFSGGIAGVASVYSKIYDVVAEGDVVGVVAGGIIGNAEGSIERVYSVCEVISDDSFASVGKDAGVKAKELYAFGNVSDDGKTEIMDISALSSLRFTDGEWTYTSEKPYPTPLADLIKTTLMGDVDGDTLVNTTDLALMKLFLAGIGSIDEVAGDLNADTRVDTTDLAMLKLKLAGV